MADCRQLRSLPRTSAAVRRSCAERDAL